MQVVSGQKSHRELHLMFGTLRAVEAFWGQMEEEEERGPEGEATLAVTAASVTRQHESGALAVVGISGKRSRQRRERRLRMKAVQRLRGELEVRVGSRTDMVSHDDDDGGGGQGGLEGVSAVRVAYEVVPVASWVGGGDTW